MICYLVYTVHMYVCMYVCMYIGATAGGSLGEGFLEQPEVQTNTERQWVVVPIMYVCVCYAFSTNQKRIHIHYESK